METQQSLTQPAHASGGEVNVYLARVAHELRTPVSLISGSLENLQESMHMLVRYVEETERLLDRNDEATRLRRDLRLDYRIENAPGLLRICSEGAQRLNHVVNQLRFYARGPAVDGDEITDPIDAVRRAVAMALPGRGIRAEVEWFVDPQVSTVIGPAEFLGQVFLNVVRNALDAMAEVADPRLEIVVRAVAGGDAEKLVEIVIGDNGPGVPEEIRDRVFDEFFSTKSAADGLGLGLSISRDIVRAVGGEIELQRTGPTGTDFRILLRAA